MIPRSRAGLAPSVHRELLDRLARDHRLVAGLLGREPGPVAGVRAVGDPHDRGRRVAVVRFASGARVVCKPRPVGPEALWWRLAAWVNDRAGEELVRAPAVAERPGYGWTTWMPRDRSPGIGTPYLRRAGVVLALLDVLEVRDAHRQNVVSSGGYPVLVDAETIAHPRLPPWEASPSLVLTGFLPAPGDSSRRAGLFTGSPGWDLSRAAVEAIAAGYRRGYDLLRRHRGALLATGGPLRGLRGLRTRVVLRPTRTYLEGIRRGAWPPPGLPPLGLPPRAREAVARAERRAILRGDVPLVRARAGSRTLEPGGRVLPLSGAGVVVRRIGGLSTAERKEMVDLIRGALALAHLASGGRGGD